MHASHQVSLERTQTALGYTPFLLIQEILWQQ
jgi:hypothetical protein